MGGSSTHVTSQKYDGVVVQSSLKGVNIPKGWGTFMTGCNLLDYLDFTAKKESSKSAGGKGGGGNATYDYKATLVLGICVGPIAGIRTIYKDQAVFTATASGSKEVNGTTITYDAQTPLQAAGLTQMFTGTIPQAPWSYLSSNHPSDAIGYPGLAYVTAENYDLNTSATSPNHNFEVQSAIRATIAGVAQDDANPADILPDLLANVPQWPAGAVGDLSTYSTYCLATGLLLSPLASGGRQASDLVTEILQATNSDCLWEDGLFKVVPYGDTPSSGNGATYTPDLTPVYDFTWDDIVPNSSGEDPVQWDLKRPIECYNYVQVSYLDRSQQYASDTVSAIDQANINAYGLRKQDAVSLNSICLQGVANTISQIMVQRSANVRRTAQWMASELFGLLSPMDLVTLPTRAGGRRLMRITEADEQEDGSIQFQGEEVLVGVAHAAEYTRQTAAGAAQDANVAPGDTNPPVLYNPPVTLTGGDYQLWLGAAGGPDWGGCDVWVSLDNESYAQLGTIRAGSRFGQTTTDFPAGSDPDTTDNLGVDLTASGQVLGSGTRAEADAKATLAVVGSEIIAYSTATATGAYTYNLGAYIRRGLYGTAIADAPAGSQFIRLDSGLFQYGYTQDRVGQTIYVKLPAYNAYGRGLQDLSLCTYYEIELGPTNVSGPTPVGRYIGAFPNLADALAAGLRNGDTYYDEGQAKLVGYVSSTATVIGGSTAAGAVQQGGSGTGAAPSTGAFGTIATASFANIPGAGFWTASGGIRVTGTANPLSGSASTGTGTYQIVEQPHAGGSASVISSGSYTATYTSGEGTEFTFAPDPSIGVSAASVNTGAVDVLLQIDITSPAGVSLAVRGSVSAQWLPAG